MSTKTLANQFSDAADHEAAAATLVQYQAWVDEDAQNDPAKPQNTFDGKRAIEGNIAAALATGATGGLSGVAVVEQVKKQREITAGTKAKADKANITQAMLQAQLNALYEDILRLNEQIETLTTEINQHRADMGVIEGLRDESDLRGPDGELRDDVEDLLKRAGKKPGDFKNDADLYQYLTVELFFKLDDDVRVKVDKRNEFERERDHKERAYDETLDKAKRLGYPLDDPSTEIVEKLEKVVEEAAPDMAADVEKEAYLVQNQQGLTKAGENVQLETKNESTLADQGFTLGGMG